jgi:hypothetical protein
MRIANMSIGRLDGVAPAGPGIHESRSGRTKKDASTPDLASKRAASPRSVESTQLRSRSSEAGVFTLTTAEGDKITISFQKQQRTRVDQATVYEPDSYDNKTKVQSQSRSSLSVSLEGSLSETELKDISDLVANLSTGNQNPAPGTIESYSFAYQENSFVSWKATGYTAKCSD